MKGTYKGELCNRNGCKGVIDSEEREGSCSCHINPPCSFCTDTNFHCTKCDWNSRDEEKQRAIDKTKHDVFNFTPRTLADLDRTKFDYVNIGHTHFTMIKEGFYPESMTIDEVREKVKGTFGGRFEYFKDGRFKYIAYTD